MVLTLGDLACIVILAASTDNGEGSPWWCCPVGGTLEREPTNAMRGHDGGAGSQRGEDGMTGALVETGGEARTLTPQEMLTFGRSERCTICLRPYDEGVSRRAGSLRCEAGTWWLANESETRPFDVIDEVGFTRPLPPGARYAIDGGRAQAVLAGLTYRYCVIVTVTRQASPPTSQRRPSTGGVTIGSQEVLVSPRERLALVALFAGYLEPFPRTTNEAATYQEAADRLAVSPDAVRRRIDHLRQKLTDAGVPDLWGPQARQHLAAYVIATRVITAEDLELLPPR